MDSGKLIRRARSLARRYRVTDGEGFKLTQPGGGTLEGQPIDTLVRYEHW